MLAETIAYRNVYIICGYTDMRKSINGLVAILTQQYQIKPDAESLYLFCGKKADRMKAILWEEDGFLLLYKVLTGYKYIDFIDMITVRPFLKYLLPFYHSRQSSVSLSDDLI